MLKRIRNWFEYLGACLALFLVRILPVRCMLALARGLSGLAFAILRRRRAVAMGNLLKTGVAGSPREAGRIGRRSFGSLAQTVVESVVVPRLLADPASARRVKLAVDAPPATVAALNDSSRGIILVSAHLGNWELAAKVCSRFKPVTGIARRMDNPYVQRLMDSRGIRSGMRTIDKHDANPMKIVRVLKRCEMLAILVDQHASGDSACTVDFLGLPARSYTTPATLQRLTGATIIVGAAIRNGPLDFTLHFSEPMRYGLGKASTDADIAAATQDIADTLSAFIRKWPEQYLWAHRRWKS